MHHLGYDDPIDLEYLANRTARRGNTRGPPPDCKLPENIYSCFSREDKIKWREFTDTAKRSVISNLKGDQRHAPLTTRQAYAHDYDPSYKDTTQSQYGETNTLDTIRSLQHSTDAAVDLLSVLKSNTGTDHDSTTGTAMSSISSRTRPPPSNSNSNDKDKLVLKSELGTGHPSLIMASKTNMNQDNVKRITKFHGTGTNYQARKHHMLPVDTHTSLEETANFNTIEYCVSKRRTHTQQSTALIDRGANGCVAGADCTFMGRSEVERNVHITGMDEHQINDIPIATVGAYVVSNRGPVIAIFHEVAWTGRHQSIISAIQLEHFRNRVDDRAEQLGGGQQITTADGYNFPLSINNGLPYMNMRAFTKDEYLSLPHVIMTSELPWDTRLYDNHVDPSSKEYKLAKPENLHLLPYDEYDVRGDYIGVHAAETMNHVTIHDNTSPEDPIVPAYVEPWMDEMQYQHFETIARCVHASKTRSQTKEDKTMKANPQEGTTIIASQKPRTHQASEMDYDKLKPYFAWIPTKMIKNTFSNSTQYGFNPVSPEGNLFKRWKSPNPAMNVFRLQDDILTDKVHSNTASVDGSYKTAQVFFGRKSHIIQIEPISKEITFLRCLQNFVRTWGAPLRMIADHIAYHSSFQVLDYLRMFCIQLWFSEAYYQHQNPFERRYQTFKRIVNRTMDRSGSPPELWLLCMQYVAYVLNRVADPTLNNRQPSFVATGSVADISAITTFRWYEPVYYNMDNKQITFPDTGEGFGFFVGIADTVGHQMTYKIWKPSTNTVIERSVVRSAWDKRFPNQRAASEHDIPPIPTDNGEDLKFRPRDFIYSIRNNQDESHTVTPDDENYGEPEYLDETGRELPQYQAISPHVKIDEDGTPLVVLTDDDGTPKRDSEGNAIMIPGKLPEDLQGITFKQRQDDGSILRARVIGPVESNLESEKGKKVLDKFKIKYDRSQVENTMAYNDIMNYIHRDLIEEDGQVWNYRRVVAHRGPLTHRDKDYKGSLYNVSIEWENGEMTDEPLQWMVKENPIPMAEYARDNNLLDTDGWKSLKPLARRAKLISRLAKQAKLRSFRTEPKYMYGFQVPRNYQEALDLDTRNGNTMWADATSLEMEQLHDYSVFLDKGLYELIGIPTDFKRIRVHLVFAVKHDGRHKARLVADGHLTDVPLNSVYAGVVSIRGLRICIFLAELNNLEAYATDIGNAYLEALTQEKVCIKAGPEFGTLEGHLLVIHKALYGLRSSGKQFGDLLACCLRELGFMPSKAEPQIFMRENDGIYEYVATYVDDLCLVMRDPESFLRILQSKPYQFKLKGSGPMSFHLGCGFERDADGTLCMNPLKYIEKMSQSYEQLFGVKLGTKPKSPLEEGDHPELDTSEFLDNDDTQKYQSLIGSMQWVITLGRWDVQTAVMSLSSFRSKPRKGHMLRARRVCAYINRFKHYKIRFRVDEPDLSDLDSITKMDWSKDVYEDLLEDIPTDAPPALGKRVTFIHWFDANLMHDVLSGKAVTGCVHFANKTPIMWHSKKQATTETATYGAEFCAGRTCIEQVVDLRNTFRYLGVPIHNISYVFGDNKSMIDSSTMPYSRLHKRHNILSFHYVRSMIARGFIAMVHVCSKNNLADVVTKHWSYNSVKGLLKPVFYYYGGPESLFVDDDDSSE